MPKPRKADAILQALLSHRTIKEAATAAGVSERAVYDYLRDPAFSARYQETRDDVIRGVSNNLRGQMNSAVDVVSAVMNDTENMPKDRLAAAKIILEYGERYTETTDILERIAALEQGMCEQMI